MAFGVVACACSSCWYEVGDPRTTGASGGAGANGGGAGVGGAAPQCPSMGCPEGLGCDAGVCQLHAQSSCDDVVVVGETTTFHGDTCDGFELVSCGPESHQQLLLHVLGGAKWKVTLPQGSHFSDVDSVCDPGLLGCKSELILDGDTFFAVHRDLECGEVTFDVVAVP